MSIRFRSILIRFRLISIRFCSISIRFSSNSMRFCSIAIATLINCDGDRQIFDALLKEFDEIDKFLHGLMSRPQILKKSDN